MTDTKLVANKPKTAAPQPIPELAADLDAGLRRLKLAAIRRTAPEVLLTAKTQRWTPEEVLRTLVESELAARDASNIVNRLKAAAFPVTKTRESFDVAASSIQPKVFDYLSSLEWVSTQSNLAIIGPAVISGCYSTVRNVHDDGSWSCSVIVVSGLSEGPQQRRG